jgi:hypothetical protein
MERQRWILGAGVGAALAALVVLSSISTEPPRAGPPLREAPIPEATAPAVATVEAAPPAGEADGVARDPASVVAKPPTAATATRAGHGGLGAAVTRAFDAAKAHGKPLLVLVAPTVGRRSPRGRAR